MSYTAPAKLCPDQRSVTAFPTEVKFDADFVMDAGVCVKDECANVFQAIKLNRTYRYAIYGFRKDDMTQIAVLKTGSPSATYENFCEDMFSAEKAKECRYGVFDAEYEGGAGMQNKILFFMWSPDGATPRQKMLYSSSKRTLTKALGQGVAKEIQANDHDELHWSNVLQLCP